MERNREYRVYCRLEDGDEAVPAPIPELCGSPSVAPTNGCPPKAGAVHCATGITNMKTAYELAMERLSKATPTVKLSDAQKKALGELDSKYAAKIAERELFLKGEITKAAEKGDYEALEQIEKQLTSERKVLREELEDKKDAVRQKKE